MLKDARKLALGNRGSTTRPSSSSFHGSRQGMHYYLWMRLRIFSFLLRVYTSYLYVKFFARTDFEIYSFVYVYVLIYTYVCMCMRVCVCVSVRM